MWLEKPERMDFEGAVELVDGKYLAERWGARREPAATQLPLPQRLQIDLFGER